MIDNNWDLINGPDAHHIEALNAASTINVLEALITFILHHKSSGQLPNQKALCELHRSGTLFLLAEPGALRRVAVYVGNDAGVVHTPPPWEAVQGYMDDFFATLGNMWNTCDALDVASYALWRINWIHPFQNGNGRTARAYAYACLCGHLGVILPGETTVIDQIMTTRSEYERVIRIADECAKAGTPPDLSEMRRYLNDLLQLQMASVPT